MVFIGVTVVRILVAAIKSGNSNLYTNMPLGNSISTGCTSLYCTAINLFTTAMATCSQQQWQLVHNSNGNLFTTAMATCSQQQWQLVHNSNGNLFTTAMATCSQQQWQLVHNSNGNLFTTAMATCSQQQWQLVIMFSKGCLKGFVCECMSMCFIPRHQMTSTLAVVFAQNKVNM